MLDARDELRKQIWDSSDKKVTINLSAWLNKVTNNFIIYAILGEYPDLKVTINRQVIRKDGSTCFEPFTDNLPNQIDECLRQILDSIGDKFFNPVWNLIHFITGKSFAFT